MSITAIPNNTLWGSIRPKLNRVFNRVAETVSDMLAQTPTNGDLVLLLGYNSIGDGGGQVLYYDSGSSATINGGTVFPGPGGTMSFSGTTFDGSAGSGGRFIAVDSSAAYPARFGAYLDGTQEASTTNALKRAIATGYQVVCGPGEVYGIDDEIEVTTEGQFIYGNGATIKVVSEVDYALGLLADRVVARDLIIDGDNVGSSLRNEGVRMQGDNVVLQSTRIQELGNRSEANGVRTLGSYCKIQDCDIENAGYAGVRADSSKTDIVDTRIAYTTELSGRAYRWVVANSIGDSLNIRGGLWFSDLSVETVATIDVEGSSPADGRNVTVNGLTIDHDEWTVDANDHVFKIESLRSFVVKNTTSNVAASFFVRVSSVSSNTVEISSVDTATDTITLAADHLLESGDRVTFSNSGGALPSPISSGSYWVQESVSATEIKISEDQYGEVLDITDSGSGTNTLVKRHSMERVVVKDSTFIGRIHFQSQPVEFAKIIRCRFRSLGMVQSPENCRVLEVEHVTFRATGNKGFTASGDYENVERIYIHGLNWINIGTSDQYLFSESDFDTPGILELDYIRISEAATGTGRTFLGTSSTQRLTRTWDGREMKYNPPMSTFYSEPVRSHPGQEAGPPIRTGVDSGSTTKDSRQIEVSGGTNKFPSVNGVFGQFIRNFDPTITGITGWRFDGTNWVEVS